MALLMAAALASAPGVPAYAQVRMPALGDNGDDGLTIASERRYGDQIMREVRRDPAYFDDPVLLEYAQGLWQRLVEAAVRRGDIGEDVRTQFPWELFLVRDRSVNAFALPGGYVGVHLGLIGLTGSTDELASVLAHELSHVSQRHIARGMASAGRQGALGLAAMILGVLAASRANSPDLAQAAIAGGQAAMIQGQLNFSREMEREADRIGLAVLQDAGFVPTGMARMFEKLEQSSRLNDAGQYPYLRTHPLTIERVAETRARVGFAPEAPVPDAQLHALMQARARVWMDDSVDAWRRLAAQADSLSVPQAAPASAPAASLREQLGVLYGAALAQSRLQQHEAARANAQALQRLAREAGAPPAVRRAAVLLQAEVELAAGAPARARALLDDAEVAAALLRPGMLLRGQAAWQAAVAGAAGATGAAGPGGAAGAAGAAGAVLAPVSPVAREVREALVESAGALQTWVAQHRADAAAWQLLARHHDVLGQPLRAARAWAETRAALGDLGAAVDLLRTARRTVPASTAADFIEASVIDARLRELEAQRREIARELRGGTRAQGAREDGGG
ncbi:MAG: hypothetical protein RI988_2717 [Pseudomonadota bacterium]|jgi:predicted Zn-dependent protease